MALCLSLASVCGQGLMAEGVPGAMKYQAVLRDMEGKPMTNQENLALRITLRQGSPTGTILYQETHNDLATDAFGLVQLEIGRGEVAKVGSANLLEVPWDNSPIYAQVEVQNDANGFTTMGVSELLSVPYALYSVNSGSGLDLTDRYLPRFDGVRNKLVDSKIKETPMEAIQFNSGAQSYTFPKTRGKEGESLVLTDGDGTLNWRTGGGGDKCEGCMDDYLVFRDEKDLVYRTSKMKYTGWEELINQPMFTVEAPMTINKRLTIEVEGENGLDIKTQVTGNHNLQYSDLPEHHVWVGGANQRSLPYKLGSGVVLDSTSDPNVRILKVEGGGGGGASVWEHRAVGSIDYIHTKVDPLRQVKVGVGLSEPKTRFQVQDGSFLLSASNGTTDVVSDLDKGYHFYWSGEKGALRMGKFDQDAFGLWRSANLGAGTIALGTDAEATQDDNVAIGAKTKALGVSALAIGRTVFADVGNAVAMGNNVKVSGQNAIGIGNGSNADLSAASFYTDAKNSVALGYDVQIGSNAVSSVVIGEYLTLDNPGSVVIGSNSNLPTGGEKKIMIGNDNETDGTPSRTIQIGQSLRVSGSDDVIAIGTEGLPTEKTVYKGKGSVSIGTDMRITNDNMERICVNIGYSNTIYTNTGDMADMGPVLLGQWLDNFGEDRGVFVGRVNDAPAESTPSNPSAFVVGVGANLGVPRNALELYENGDLYLLAGPTGGATVYAGDYQTTSDRRLKTDIEPLNADFSVLKSLSPMRYRLIADRDKALKFGFIAQDVERYFPHLVNTDSKGKKTLNYIGLLPVLWQYTQQLEKTVSDQATEIERLRTETEALKADMKAIKAKLGL